MSTDIRRAADLAQDRYAVARAALSEVPLAVVLVGAGTDDGRSCATGTAMYVSFAPPQVAVALHPGSRTCRLAEAAGAFGISVLRADQQDVAAAAGRGGSGPDKFAEIGLSASGLDELPGALVAAEGAFGLWCRTVQALDTGDHRLLVGEVVAFAGGGAERPLLRHQRRYAALGDWLSEPAPEGYPT